ncbi:MAG: DUF58 domain-containing protein, partial [Planctomycetota bacterium]
RRLGRVFLRLFEELEDLPVYLLPDISRSMYLEEPPRARAGLRCALALASIALGQHDSVGLLPFSNDLQIGLRPRAGKGSLMRFAEAMGALEPGGETDLCRSVRTLTGLSLREGLVVLISDLFDPAGAEGVTQALGRLRHRLLIVQLVRGSDREPGLAGDLRLRDCESGRVEDVSATPPVLERYRQAYERFERTILDFARRRDIGLLRLDADEEVLPQLATLFETGSYVV